MKSGPPRSRVAEAHDLAPAVRHRRVQRRATSPAAACRFVRSGLLESAGGRRRQDEHSSLSGPRYNYGAPDVLRFCITERSD